MGVLDQERSLKRELKKADLSKIAPNYPEQIVEEHE